MLVALLAVFSFAIAEPGPAPLPVSLPSPDKRPPFREGLSPAAPPAPIPQKRFYGVGIGFQAHGGTQGIALEQVVADSPADRAGFVAGLVIVEIDGHSTLGRSGEDCTHMVREAGDKVTLRYYDPVTFKIRTRTLEKEWFLLPN